jgi:hypothetical protein
LNSSRNILRHNPFIERVKHIRHLRTK